MLPFFEDEKENEPQGTTNLKQPHYDFHPGFIFSLRASERVPARVNVYMCVPPCLFVRVWVIQT